MVNKIFGVKNITHLLYGFIVLLPMMAILGRVCYTIANKNAKDNYSKRVDNDEYELIDNLDDFNLNNYYLFDSSTFVNNTSSATGSYSRTISYSNFNLITYNGTQTIDFNQYNQFGLYIAQDGVLSISFRDNNGNQSSTLYFYSSQLAFTFSYISNSLNYNFASTNIFYVFNTNSDYYLDNAFEYSLKTFTEDNNLGEVDMFSWFTDLFLDNSNAHNQIYIGFVNWYLNYTMLVSCGYLFFLVLIWFINFIRRILDKSMYQDYGGF